MDKIEGYQPTGEDIQKAEGFLDAAPALKAQSKERAKYHFQESAVLFHDFMDSNDLYKDTTERRQPSVQEKERIDRYLTDLGNLLKGSGVRWNIDGALNISLMRGQYIGVHRDIDISVEEEDLEKLDEALGRKGYGIFLSENLQDDPEGKRKLERVGAMAVRNEQNRHLVIAKINEQGAITPGEQLNYLDVHLIRRGKDGGTLAGEGATMSESWDQAQPVEFNGTELRLSHPAKVAYYKLRQGRDGQQRQGRAYDTNDLKLLVESGSLTFEHVNDIELLLQKEQAARNELIKNGISALKPEMDAGDIYNVLAENPEVKPVLESVKPALESLSKEIADNPNQAYKLALKYFGRQEFYKDQLSRVGLLRQWIKDNNEIQETRQKLK